MKSPRTNRHAGFTLVELMVAVAIIAVLSAVALPLYNDYVQTSREGVLVNNVSSIQVFQEDLFLRTGAYAAGNYDVGGGDTGLANAPLNWDPRGDDTIVYNVVLANGGASYEITATDSTGVSICRRYPEDDAC